MIASGVFPKAPKVQICPKSFVFRRRAKIYVNKRNRLNKNPNWWETDQLAVYKHDRAVELGFAEKQLQLGGQSGT